MIGKIFYIFLKAIRSSKIITSIVWGIKIKEYCHETFWDLTTLVIKKEMSNRNDKIRYLDMGCGQFAILGQFFKRRNIKSEVISVDIYDEFIENSKMNSKLNNNQILIIKSNLFSNLNEKFDLITFNPPYVPTTNNLGNNNYPNIRFSGSDGLKTTKEFLIDAKNYLSTTGEILLGINTFYVPQRSCLDIIYNTGYKLKKITYMKFNTSVVFRLSIV